MLIDQIKKTSSSQPVKHLLTDKFSDQKSAGQVLGTPSLNGTIRKGKDVEKRMKIDNNALRLQPLLKPGWQRQGIAYGPYTRCHGLAFAIFLLNGHNTSQIDRVEPLKARLYRWLIGTETDKPTQRLWRWIWHGPKIGLIQKLLWWVRTTSRISKYFQRFPLTPLNENLAVGWFANEVPTDPTTEGNTFTVHATGTHNGELWLRTQDNLLSALRGLQNLQVYYVVILREQGAAYYAASVSDALGLGTYPNLRPLGIDAFEQSQTVYAGFYQSILGQNGFRVDTRVYGVEVAQLRELATWYGTAHLADYLAGEGDLDQTVAEQGGTWKLKSGNYQRTATGLVATEPNSFAILQGNEPSGLIHLLVYSSTQPSEIQLIWRFQDWENYWSFRVDSEQCQLQLIKNGQREIVALSQLWSFQANTINALQILDDGETFSLFLNSQLVFRKRFIETRLQNATGVGIGSTQANPHLFFRALEAHPRSIPIPAALNMGSPWDIRGQEVIISDSFTGETGELDGKK
ncbi:MAG: nucleotide-binding protein, partial [Cyanobacteriota bacterium]|nr:nucleotide-binding protein [Cyanobacteriota bacterium]